MKVKSNIFISKVGILNSNFNGLLIEYLEYLECLHSPWILSKAFFALLIA